MKHTQSESSAGKDKNRCRFCGKEFVPAWNHPQQNVCNARECRGKAAAERSRRYSKNKKAKQAGRDVFAAKERRTYLHRNALELLAGNEINPLAFVRPGQKLSLANISEALFRMELTIDGLICILNTRLDTQNFSRAECYEFGKSLFRNRETQKNE